MIFGRSRPRTPPEAVYARVLDGRHLWLAVRGADELWLASTPLPLDPDPTDPDLAVAVVPLPDDPDAPDLVLRTGPEGSPHAEPVRLAYPEPVSPASANLGFDVVDDGEGLVVRRIPPTPGVTVLALAAVDAGAVVTLDTTAPEVELAHRDAVLARLPARDGEVLISQLPDLPVGRTARLRVDGLPALRRAGVFPRPHYLVQLPPLDADPGLELRWLPGGLLAVHREEGA